MHTGHHVKYPLFGHHVKYPLFLSDFKDAWIFSTDFRKKLQISNFMKIRPVGAELFHADRRTDMMKLIVTFRNFANASEKSKIVSAYNIKG
jgi:hypothetical protein